MASTNDPKAGKKLTLAEKATKMAIDAALNKVSETVLSPKKKPVENLPENAVAAGLTNFLDKSFGGKTAEAKKAESREVQQKHVDKSLAHLHSMLDGMEQVDKNATVRAIMVLVNASPTVEQTDLQDWINTLHSGAEDK